MKTLKVKPEVYQLLVQHAAMKWYLEDLEKLIKVLPIDLVFLKTILSGKFDAKILVDLHELALVRFLNCVVNHNRQNKISIETDEVDARLWKEQLIKVYPDEVPAFINDLAGNNGPDHKKDASLRLRLLIENLQLQYDAATQAQGPLENKMHALELRIVHELHSETLPNIEEIEPE